jgi:hypothetical protein
MAARRSLLSLLKEARSWNLNDLRAFDDASPSQAMLEARRRVLTQAIAAAQAQRAALRRILEVTAGPWSPDRTENDWLDLLDRVRTTARAGLDGGA